MRNKQSIIQVEGVDIYISNPDKVLFQESHLKKWEYVLAVSRLAPYLLPYCKNRLLTVIRFPDGPNGKSFYQKNVPKRRPEWVDIYESRGIHYIVLNNMKTLVWLANLACLEFHTSFHIISNPDCPTELVFDIDPSVPDFRKVIEVAFEVKELLKQLNLTGYVKTSGATGLQIYVPILQRYTYEETRLVAEFTAKYLANKRPDIVTLERKLKNRGDKVYFDYLQHWRNKTLIAAYSPRGTNGATISCPLAWDELSDRNLHPSQFNLSTIFNRLDRVGDLFHGLYQSKNQSSLDDIIYFINKHSKS